MAARIAVSRMESRRMELACFGFLRPWNLADIQLEPRNHGPVAGVILLVPSVSWKAIDWLPAHALCTPHFWLPVVPPEKSICARAHSHTWCSLWDRTVHPDSDCWGEGLKSQCVLELRAQLLMNESGRRGLHIQACRCFSCQIKKKNSLNM